MKDRKRQRENRKKYKRDPRRNASGCMDMTAYIAVKNADRQLKEEKKKNG